MRRVLGVRKRWQHRMHGCLIAFALNACLGVSQAQVLAQTLAQASSQAMPTASSQTSDNVAPQEPSQGPVDSDSTRAVLVALSGSVLRVEAPRAQGGLSLGSAVVLDSDTVVTNCHVTRDAREVFVVRGGARWRAKTQLSDIGHDLCLLQVPDLHGIPVRIGQTAALSLGQTVLAMGYTGGVGIQTSQGDVVGLHHHDGARVVESNNGFNSGASGGGLFDAQGRLVGILTFRLRGAEQAYFSAPTEWLQALMLDHAKRATPVLPLPAEALTYWQQAAATQPRFLRAASMLQASRFVELETLAMEWLRADAKDGEPWFLLGAALQAQGRDAQARWALACALVLEPTRAQARRRLDQLSAQAQTGAASSAAPAPSCAAL
jgi:serine protease Do